MDGAGERDWRSQSYIFQKKQEDLCLSGSQRWGACPRGSGHTDPCFQQGDKSHH